MLGPQKSEADISQDQPTQPDTYSLSGLIPYELMIQIFDYFYSFHHQEGSLAPPRDFVIWCLVSKYWYHTLTLQIVDLPKSSTQCMTISELSKFPCLLRLRIAGSEIPPAAVSTFRCLQTLEAPNIRIPPSSLFLLTDLTYLNNSGNRLICDKALFPLTNLTYLNLNHSSANLTDASISRLTNLTYLNIYFYKHITGHGISTLTKLKELDAYYYAGHRTPFDPIAPGLRSLQNLRVLRIQGRGYGNLTGTYAPATATVRRLD
jgi:hypothetical protein